MSFDVFISALTSGFVGGASVLLPTLAIALLYEHGRYIPLWLPDLGLLGAYILHAMWSRGLPGSLSAVIALAVSVVVALSIHRVLIARFLSTKDYLSPLLIGLGISQMFQAVTSFYGEGMSQHYPDNMWTRQFFSETLGAAIYWVDLSFVLITGLSLCALYAYLHLTNWGTKIRMVMANPDDSRKLALPVKTVDLIVLATAAILITAGTIMRGIRFDLQPSMMFYPGLGAISACIVATPGRRLTSLCVVVAIEILASLAGATPSLSGFQRAVPFAVLLSVLVFRSVALPLIARRTTEKNNVMRESS